MKRTDSKLSETPGEDLDKKQPWRSLDELAAAPLFEKALHREFPEEASEFKDEVSRRNFLKVMGASVALAGTTACRQPLEKIVPYVRQPEEIVPGKPLFYATAMPLNGYGHGVLVESHEGRPTKIEGNPDHPASLGATTIFTQASILDLYDPDRSKTVLQNGKPVEWSAFINAAVDPANTKARIRILSQTVTSPTLATQINAFLERFPAARWHQWQPINQDNSHNGSQLAFQKLFNAQYHFDKANTVLSLDGDFLSEQPGSLRYARELMKRPGVAKGETKANRVYAVESTPTLAGTIADHRLAVRASDVERFAWALLSALKTDKVTAHPADNWTQWIQVLARDLQANQGRSLIYAGAFQSPYVHALAHLLNLSLGNVGQTITYTNQVEARPEVHADSLRDLATQMKAGAVDTLIILEGNPLYNAPADLEFAAALKNVKHSIHLSLYENETSASCEWHIPAAHYLESWSDVRAFDGTVSIIQPLIAPLYDGKTTHELLEVFLGGSRSAHEVVRQHWKEKHSENDFEQWWEKSLHDGVIAGTSLPSIETGATVDSILNRLARNTERSANKESSDLEILFRPDPTIHDGAFSKNGWLQELPKPLTQLTWDNPVLLSSRTAKKYDVTNGDIVELSLAGKTVRAPIWILPGQADDCATVTLGYGREHAGRVGDQHGFNFYKLRASEALWTSTGLHLQKTGEQFPLACTQNHQTMEGRDLVRVRNVGTLANEPKAEKVSSSESLYPPFRYEDNAWGMTIDLTACIGCKACTIACQAENNIPVVGKPEVMRGREMHWIRVDRYFSGSVESPRFLHQPVPCMHCENAPCEVVCPVAATTHSAEGLNEMTYNRCIGTRYCSNNCPYKVRRFNFFQYADQKTESYKLMWNPDVTVRARGVMEKCTYCVQRINVGRIQAKKENRAIRDGEVITACQAACPTEAIIFGNINDPASKVARAKASPLNYGLLTELNTRPRTTYLARVRNPNPELAAWEEQA